MRQLDLLLIGAIAFGGACLEARGETTFPPTAPIDTTQFDPAGAAASAQSAAVSAAAAAAPGLAPVQSVNTKTNVVTIPTLCRQQSAALPIPQTNPGAVSWTFPNTTCSFSASPSCWMDISTATLGFAFDYPLNTARTTTAVTYSFTSHASGLTISLGALTVTLAPPANTSVVMTCTAPPV